MKKTRTEKFFIGAKILPSIIFIILIVCAFLYKDRINLETLISFSPQNIVLATVYILLCFMIKSISIAFPIAALFLFSGQMFSITMALWINLLGIIIVVTLPYFIGKYLGNELTEFLKIKYSSVKKLDDFAQMNPYFFCYITRVINILPGDIVSLYLGATNIKYRTFLVGSVAGMAPTMIAITVMGDNITRPNSIEFVVALFVTAVFSFLSIPIYKFAKNKN